MHRYYCMSRPPSFACYPQKPFPVKIEMWLPERHVPTEENDQLRAFGFVDYEAPLGVEDVNHYGLMPESKVEQAENMFASMPEGAARREDYMSRTIEELQEMIGYEAKAAIVLKRAEMEAVV